jgi:HAMP domain-containing protein
MAVMLGVAVVAGLALTLGAARGVTGPLGRLRGAMRAVADGALETEVPGQT